MVSNPPAPGVGMITGTQLAEARQLSGIGTQADLAVAAGVSRPTIERAEQARDGMVRMRTDQLSKVIKALEDAGIEFVLPAGRSLVGGAEARLRQRR